MQQPPLEKDSILLMPHLGLAKVIVKCCSVGSDESILSIQQQDYHACMLNHVLTAISCYYAQGYIDPCVSKRKLTYKINFSKAIYSVKDILVNDYLKDLDIRQTYKT